MPLLPASGRRASLWKNGGGSTTEIAISPDGAGLDAFDWRVSMASVERDGPFSLFPGVDRLLAIVEGSLILEVEGAPAATLDAASPPHAFPGDAPTFGRLTGGAVLDLNVMTRRDVFAARMMRLDSMDPQEIAPQGEALLIVLEGAADLQTPEGGARLGPRDAWRGQGGSWRLAPAPYVRAALVEFSRRS